MRAQQIPLAKTCQDCPTVFMGTPRKRFCDACGTRRSRASDSEKRARRELREHHDLSPAQIERLFTEALREIRRQGLYTGDATWNHHWKYDEPGR